MRNEEQTLCRDHALLVSSIWPNSSLVIFDAFGDFLFFNSKKKEAKNAALKRRGTGTAQIAFVTERHARACEGKLQEGGWLRDGLARCA